ncbi:DnaJ-like chaperonin [Gordonia phage RedWattleHog]|uniref:DnaJ-like chaperonin n=1 Tax=Gordonia phage Stormageddon TaxID=2656541 RepID=A0A649VR08_9CAUD|nr:DnaJ-like chaperonin [Gordonia phage Stormageddon]QGJ94937.1 DnaJ-like chaperonin [Gordonia phage Stormageddon]QLF83581.1 DnaJ-like chaperonin [Gordonia phage RedWattleHog]
MWHSDLGVGFPSTSRELVLRPRNTADPNGYYADLDLPPWASEREIARRCRWLLSRFHPDGPAPNEELYAHIAMISKVLRDPAQRSVYEATPEGSVYVDAEVVRKFQEEGRGDELAAANKKSAPSYWTYLSDRKDSRDRELAGQWYEVLLRAAYDVGWNGRIRLHLVSDQVNAVVGEEVYVWRHRPSYERARQLLDPQISVSGVG